MTLLTTTDADEIIAMVTPLLAADPVRNTVFSSIVSGVRNEDADGWCAWPAGDPRVLAVRSQRHTPVTVTAGWQDLAELAEAVAALAPVAAIGGPARVVEPLAAALETRGLAVSAHIRERLFRLDELNEPTGVRGRARLASWPDADLLSGWFADFMREAFGALRRYAGAATVRRQRPATSSTAAPFPSYSPIWPIRRPTRSTSGWDTAPSRTGFTSRSEARVAPVSSSPQADFSRRSRLGVRGTSVG
ncbi:MAG: hypothetical protein ACR2LF_08420 [Jatrophihabitantaceae bacterium]